MRAPRTHVPGIVYHVYARGVGGQDIVAGAEDWDELQALTAEAARACDVRLYAFCLMSNHYHLLLEIGQVSLSRFMQRIQTAWSRRFNIARGRWGHVFQDRFKHRVCDGDAYFKRLLRYSQLKPVKEGMVATPAGSRVRRVRAARRAFVAAAFRAGHTLTSIVDFGGISVQAASKLLRSAHRGEGLAAGVWLPTRRSPFWVAADPSNLFGFCRGGSGQVG